LVADYIASNRGEFEGKAVLDVGSGSGILSLFALSQGASYVVAVDVNRLAALSTLCTLLANGHSSFDVVSCDFRACFRENAARSFDVALINPPYLPVDFQSAECSDRLSWSWCGGPSGAEATLQLLESLERAGLPGEILLVVSTAEDWESVLRKLREMKYEAEEVSSKRFFFEELKLVRGVLNG